MSTIKVEGMKCGHCSGAIKEALEKANAGTVEVDLEKKTVSWSGELEAQKVKEIIDAQGFTATIG